MRVRCSLSRLKSSSVHTRTFCHRSTFQASPLSPPATLDAPFDPNGFRPAGIPGFVLRLCGRLPAAPSFPSVSTVEESCLARQMERRGRRLSAAPPDECNACFRAAWSRCDAAVCSFTHTLHVFFRRACAQKAAPPQSEHWRRILPCSQIAEPRQLRHVLLYLPCSQMAAPPHSLHCRFCRPCSQRLPPPQSLQIRRCRPWMHMLRPPHSRHEYRCLP